MTDIRTLSLVVVLAAVLGLALLLAVLCQPAQAQATLDGIVPPAESDPGPAVAGPSRSQSSQVVGDGQFLGNLPLRFIPNAGQTDALVRYTVNGAGHTLSFTPEEVVFAAVGAAESGPRRSVVRLRFNGANPAPAIEGLAPMEGVVNYFLGSDPAGWRANVPTYKALAYRGVYPGIDLVYRGTEGYLKSEFLVAPGADPSVIQMVFHGVEELHLREDGALVLQTPLGELIEEAPLIYQDVGGVRQVIPGGFMLLGGTQVGFQVGTYDCRTPLVIDPALTYSSYLGGSGADKAWDNTVDGAGNIYVVGETASSNFPTHSEMYSALGGSQDAFVTKIISAGGVYTYAHSTYLGGSGNDIGWGVGVDGGGNVYVSGETWSNDFPPHNAIDTSLGGSKDAFVTKIISASGVYTLGYSTYLGGSSDEGFVTRLAVDTEGSAYVAGTTWSSNFPTHNAIDTSLGGGQDAFVTTIISANGVYTYGYSTYLGGTSYEYSFAIAVDSEGNAHITGDTGSSNFPTQNPIQASYAGGYSIYGGDIFVTKIISTGGAYAHAFSTYLGGNKADQGLGIAVDNTGAILVTGRTYSNDASNSFPTHNAVQPNYQGGYDAVVTKIISASGVYTYAYSTFLGSSGSDDGNDIAVDGLGNAYVTGNASANGFPVTAGAIQATHRAGYDAFFTKIVSASGIYTYGYSTYLGGGGSERARGIAVDGVGNIHLVGETTSSDWPTSTNAIQPSHGGGSYDAFVAIIAPFSDLAISKSVTPALVAPGQALTYTLVYTYAGSAIAADVHITDEVPITLTNVQYTKKGADITPTGDISYTWQVGPLAPGSGGVITITGIISPDVGGVFSLANQVSITGGVHFVDDSPGDETATVTNTVDGESPLAPTLASPPNGMVVSDTTSTLTWNASPSPDVVGYLLDWNGTVMDVGDVNQHTTNILADGTYTWTVAAYDAARNTSAYTDTWSFTVDGPPAVPTLVSPTDGTVVSDTTPTLTWQASPSPDVAGYLLDWNGMIVDVGDVTSYTTGILVDGTYTWTVAAYDAARNTSAYTDTWSFTVDGPPAAPTLASPPDGTVVSDTTPTLTWQASPSPDVAGYLLDWNGTVMDVGDVTEHTTGVLADGTYTWTVAAYDGLQNTSAYTDVWSFTVTGAIPDVPITQLNAANDSPTLLGETTMLSATIATGSNVTYAWAFGDGTFGSGAVVTHTYPDVDIYTAIVTASNSVSELTATTTVTISQPYAYIYLPLVLRASP